MNNSIVRLSIASLAAAALAACGGGGSGSSAPTGATPAVKVSSVPSTSGSSAPASFANGTTKISFSFTRKPAGTKGKGPKSAGRKSPTYISQGTAGFQVSVTPAGGTATVYNIAFNPSGSLFCTPTGPSAYACTLLVPTLAASETIGVLELDQRPTGTIDPSSGISNMDFPTGTAVLASGSTTATLTPGGITLLTMNLNPVIGGWYDCGLLNGSSSIQEDGSGSTPRIVMTGNVASSAILHPFPVDYDSDVPAPVLENAAFPVGQPYIDLNGTATPLTAVPTLSNVTTLPLLPQGGGSPASPSPFATFNAITSIPDSSYEVDPCCGMFVAVRYDGFGTPSGAMKTLTMSNNLSAPPPAFTGTPSVGLAPANYLATLVYGLAPVFATAAAATATHSTSTLVVTGYDPGSPNSMGATHCYDASHNDLGNFTSTGAMTNGVQPFVFNAGAATGTCTFTLFDTNENVPSNPVNITIQ